MDIELTHPTNTQMNIETSSSSFEFAATALIDLSSSPSSSSSTPRKRKKHCGPNDHGRVRKPGLPRTSLVWIKFSTHMNISIVFSLALFIPVQQFICCTCVEAVDKKRKHGRAYNDCHQYNELLHSTTINRLLTSCRT